MRPDDIPQDVWETAQDHAETYIAHETMDLETIVARAIMAERRAAHQLHRRAQKAEGAILAATAVLDRWEEALNTSDQRRAAFEMTLRVLQEISTAIRNRGSA